MTVDVQGVSLNCENFRFTEILLDATPKSHLYPFPIPSHTEGRWPSSRTLGRDAVDAAASGAWSWSQGGLSSVSGTARGRPAMLRTAKPCGPGTRCWCQAGGGFSRPNRVRQSFNPSATVTRRIRRRGERGISRKTIAQGMSECFR